jgi:protease-4
VNGGTFFFYDQPKGINQGILGGGITTEGGIEQTIISAGRSKDLGNPFRRLTDEEKAVLQSGVDSIYQDFVGHIAQERNIPLETIIEEMGAQIFANEQAQSYGLIDSTKSWDEALNELAGLAGLGDDFQLVEKRAAQISPLQRLLFFGKSNQKDLATLTDSIERDRCAAARHFALVYFGELSALCVLR